MFKPFALTSLLVAAFVLSGCGGDAGRRSDAAWFLDPAESSINFITAKNGDVVESNRFGAINGSITRAGHALIEIQAASVDTQLDTRDERVRSYIFNIEEYPLIAIEADVDLEEFRQLETGESQLAELQMAVNAAGRTNTLFATVRVTRAARDTVLITTIDPVLVDMRDFGMEDGLETLVNLAGLKSITPVTPVSVFLVFERS